jgi:hypothetical protein
LDFKKVNIAWICSKNRKHAEAPASEWSMKWTSRIHLRAITPRIFVANPSQLSPVFADCCPQKQYMYTSMLEFPTISHNHIKNANGHGPISWRVATTHQRNVIRQNKTRHMSSSGPAARWRITIGTCLGASTRAIDRLGCLKFLKPSSWFLHGKKTSWHWMLEVELILISPHKYFQVH